MRFGFGGENEPVHGAARGNFDVRMLPMRECGWLAPSYPEAGKPRNLDGALKIF